MSTRTIIVSGTVLILLAGGVYYWRMQQYTAVVPQGGQPQLPIQSITVGSSTVSAEIASTQDERNQGLSGRLALAQGSGMLFVFAGDGNWGFWMPDMHFSIDIIWADAGGAILSIDSDVSPASYPSVYYPNGNARYVLEVPAGFAAAEHITVGSHMSIPEI